MQIKVNDIIILLFVSKPPVVIEVIITIRYDFHVSAKTAGPALRYLYKNNTSKLRGHTIIKNSDRQIISYDIARFIAQGFFSFIFIFIFYRIVFRRGTRSIGKGEKHIGHVRGPSEQVGIDNPYGSSPITIKKLLPHIYYFFFFFTFSPAAWIAMGWLLWTLLFWATTENWSDSYWLTAPRKVYRKKKHKKNYVPVHNGTVVLLSFSFCRDQYEKFGNAPVEFARGSGKARSRTPAVR